MKDDNPCIPHQLASPTACLLPDLDLASTPQQYTQRAYATHKKCLYTYGEGSRAGESVHKESLNPEKLHEPGLHKTCTCYMDREYYLHLYKSIFAWWWWWSWSLNACRPATAKGSVYLHDSYEILHFGVAKMLNHNCRITTLQKVMLKKFQSSAHHFAHGDNPLAQTDLSECDKRRTMEILEA